MKHTLISLYTGGNWNSWNLNNVPYVNSQWEARIWSCSVFDTSYQTVVPTLPRHSVTSHCPQGSWNVGTKMTFNEGYWYSSCGSESHSVVSDSLQRHGPQNSPGQNTGVSSLSLRQGIFPTQGSNPGLPHCRRILYKLSHKGSPTQFIGNLKKFVISKQNWISRFFQDVSNLFETCLWNRP